MSDRRRWFATLAMLVNPDFPDRSAPTLLRMMPLLQDLPDELFTDATVRHVAGWRRRTATPAFDEIQAALRDFRATFMPRRLPALPAPEPAWRGPKDEAEREAMSAQAAALVAELAEMKRTREAREEAARPAVRPLADVTAKGAELEAIRAARRQWIAAGCPPGR